MCGRFNITSDPLTQLLMEVFGIAHQGPDNPNTAPTETVGVVRAAPAGFACEPLRWWLTPRWAKERSSRYAMFNARSETLRESRAFARPFAERRCVVPISGFYEWSKDGGRKLPYYIRARDRAGLLLAGLWDRWTDRESGEVHDSFTIVTTAASPGLAFVHHRQPVMLSSERARGWLDTDASVDELAAWFEPALPHTLVAEPVSTEVNNARNKDARCAQPIAPGREIRGEDAAD